MIEIIELPHYPVDVDATVNSDHEVKFPLPDFATEGAGAIDLRSASWSDITLEPGQDFVFPTGIKMNMQTHTYPFRIAGILLPRSGLGFKFYTRLANTVGLIDQDYQGEIMVKIRNEGTDDLTIKVGERMCQMMFIPVLTPEFIKVTEFSEKSARGEAGFGSTGVQ